MERKTVAVVFGFLCIGVLLGAFITFEISNTLNLHGQIGFGLTVDKPYEVHATITMYKDGVLVFKQYHAGAVTNLGDNMTIFKMFGKTDYQYGAIAYTANISYISIGNQGTLNTGSVVLPGEWNRTVANPETISQSVINMSCTFYPDASGPYTADCIGLNFGSSGNDLWGYDTFTEVTGIDETFTINVEFQVTVSHT